MRRLLSRFEPKRDLEIERYDSLEYLAVICYYYAFVILFSLVARPCIVSDECTLDICLM